MQIVRMGFNPTLPPLEAHRRDQGRYLVTCPFTSSRHNMPILRIPRMPYVGDLVRMYINRDIRADSKWRGREIISLLPIRETDRIPDEQLIPTLVLVNRPLSILSPDGPKTDSFVRDVLRIWEFRSPNSARTKCFYFTLALLPANKNSLCLLKRSYEDETPTDIEEEVVLLPEPPIG